MSFFGVDNEHLSWLADELSATAPFYDGNTQKAMEYLSRELARLAPLFEAICDYCDSECQDEYTDGSGISDGGVVYAYKHLLASNNASSTTDK